MKEPRSGGVFHRKSFYRKLRLPAEWVLDELANVGFRKVDSSVENGLVTVVATKNE